MGTMEPVGSNGSADPDGYVESGTIFVNGRFTTQVLTGVQRYAWEITKRLERNLLRLVKPQRALPAAVGHLWEQAILPWKLERNALLWSPGGSGPLSVANQVITVHDIAQIEHPEWYTSRFATWYAWLTPRLLKRAVHILTVSEFSRNRIIQFYNVAPEKITAIPLGVDQRFFTANRQDALNVLRKYGLPDRFILTVGSVSPRKNFSRILSAWQQISHHYPDTYLVAVGHPSLRFVPTVSSIPIPNRVLFPGYIPDIDLPSLYRASLAFLYPSLYEGFGLPVLEAMAAGVPVVTSRCTAMLEFAANSTLLTDPENDADIAAAIQRLLDNDQLRQQLALNGPIHAREYSWKRTADLTFDALRTVKNQLC